MKRAVTPNSIWRSDDDRRFQVIHTITDDQGHEWVHYRLVCKDHCEEYSCWTESFLHRFTEATNESI